MAALKRNDPCPCGSGKKYKKCCLKKLNTKSRFDEKDQRDFNELLPKVFDYSKNFDEEIKPAFEQKNAALGSLESSDAKAFSQLLYHWMLFNWKNDNNKTVLDSFLKEFKDNYSSSFQKFLKDWMKLEPRFFYIIYTDKEYIALKDMWDDKTQTIHKTPVSENIEAGQYITGYLYPAPEGPSLGNDALQLPPRLAEAFHKECLTAGLKKQKRFTKQFDLMLQLLSILVKHGTEQPAEYTSILDKLEIDSKQNFTAAAIKIREYLRENNPRVNKPEAFAAALDYWIGIHVDKEKFISQKAAAKKYSVAATTVSSRYKQLSNPQKLETTVQ
ncbi:SEC-C domain-containing protein [Alkalicoccus halolimnae]|uniref:SEC-C domain-containing protein n=1 Tax=Alkalicoccus halolimnae TaxID=1667239 RepID=A0AAJ8LYX9_9BACI|nr:SEC-C domain-containing protein [Alkalicoccus halolimnae]